MWLQVMMITLSYGLTGVKSICGGLMEACGLLDLLGNAVSMQKFYYPNIYWKGSVAGHKQSKRFLECSKNNFRLQVLDEPKKRRFSVEPATREWFGTRKVSGSFGGCDHKMMVFKVLREVRQVSGRILVVIRRTEPDHPGDVQKRTRKNGSIQIFKFNVTLKLAVLWVGSWTNDLQMPSL